MKNMFTFYIRTNTKRPFSPAKNGYGKDTKINIKTGKLQKWTASLCSMHNIAWNKKIELKKTKAQRWNKESINWKLLTLMNTAGFVLRANLDQVLGS